MSNNYLINTSEDYRGYHEVHVDTCSHLPLYINRENLGAFYNCASAVREAKSKYPNWKIDGCYYCSESCHQW